jgi:hypothetical protein
VGLSVIDAAEVSAEQLWVHDNPNRGVSFQGYNLELSGSLVELNGEAGVYIDDASVDIVESVVRDSLLDSAGLSGRGIYAPAGGFVTVHRSLIERNHTAGIALTDGQAWAASIVVRDTLPDATGAYGWGVTSERCTLDLWQSIVEHNRGVGVNVHGYDAWMGSVVVRGTQADQRGLGGWGLVVHADREAPFGFAHLSHSLVEGNRELGLLADSAEMMVIGVVVRGTQPNDSGDFGRGVTMEPGPDAPMSTYLLVSGSVIEDNHDVGVFASGGEAIVELSVVRGTQPGPGGVGGRGIAIQPQADVFSSFELATSLLEGNHEAGVSVVGVDALVRESIIRDTLPRADGRFGRGMNVQNDAALGRVASLTLQSTLIERSYEAGLALFDATAQIEKSIVRDSRAIADGRFGDGVLALANDATAGVEVVQSRIEASARAAVSAFGAQVAVGQSQLLCQPFDVASEPWNQAQSVFDDRGENWCGCPVAQGACELVSAGLEAPEPLAP